MASAYDRAILHETYSHRARIISRSARLVLQPMLRVVPLTNSSIRVIRRLDGLYSDSPRSKYVEPVKFELNGIPAESMTHRYSPESAMTILYLHGGGFFSCGIESHRRICETLAKLTGATVVSVDYVQLPDGTIADSVQDAITAYEVLLQSAPDPTKIVVAGDSAGGYLAMKVAELATRRDLRTPAAILGFSPMLSLDPEREDKAVERMVRVRDAYLPRSRFRTIRKLWTANDSVIEGFAAPLHASAYIASPVFLTVVEDEILRPEVEAMSMLLTGKGVEVETHIWRRGVHAFPVIADLLPEGREALRLAARFARRAAGELDTVRDEVVAGELIPEEASVDKILDDVIEDELIGDHQGARFPQVG